jgi:hypothetical protein
MTSQHWWNYAEKDNEVLEDNLSKATTTTINLSWTGLRLNPGLRDETTATNCLNLILIFCALVAIRTVGHKISLHGI